MNRAVDFFRYLAATVLALGLLGCRNLSGSSHSGLKFYDAGVRAEEQGDLLLARQNFYRAWRNAQVGPLDASAEAYPLYEWSRVTGYLGMHAEAEGGFANVLALIDKADGKADTLRSAALCELARLLHDTKQHPRAIPAYEQAIAELQKREAPQKDPVGFAEFLDDYAESLRAVGEQKAAKAVAQRSAAIKQDNPSNTARLTPRRYTQ